MSVVAFEINKLFLVSVPRNDLQKKTKSRVMEVPLELLSRTQSLKC